jgi:hypothetical protein
MNISAKPNDNPQSEANSHHRPRGPIASWRREVSENSPSAPGLPATGSETPALCIERALRSKNPSDLSMARAGAERRTIPSPRWRRHGF